MDIKAAVARVKELDAKRTQGEWGDVCPDYYGGEAVLFLNFDEKNRIATGHDAAFIAHAPQMAAIIAQLWDEREQVLNQGVVLAKSMGDAMDKIQQQREVMRMARGTLVCAKQYAVGNTFIDIEHTLIAIDAALGGE